MPALPDIVVSAVAVIRDRRVLMVTARGRDVIYMPGGKVDAGESGAEAAAREAREELGVDVTDITELFTVTTQAHGEPEGRRVRMTVYAATPLAQPRASAEIDALHWVTSADAHRCPPAGRETLRSLQELQVID
ncbi:NUDIX domain-containing protein [Microbacteriaceae bacterium VKM Ac-2854]|nr:NUDIX domain-containing protein [Microbacteriaceae bacterium VKM Ac-2854]